MKRRLFGAVSAVAMLLCASAALAAPPAPTNNYYGNDQNGTYQTFCSKLAAGVQYPCHLFFGTDVNGNPASTRVGQGTKAQSLAVALPTDPDIRSTGSITAADSATTSAAGMSGVNVVSGTPTANSAVIVPTNGHSSVSFVVGAPSGSVALQVEECADAAGTVCAGGSAKQLGNGLVLGSITGAGIFRVDAAGMSAVRLRASACASCSVAIAATATNAPGMTQVTNPQRLQDSTGAEVTDATGHSVKQGLPSWGASGVTPVTGTFTTSTTIGTCSLPFPAQGGLSAVMSVWASAVTPSSPLGGTVYLVRSEDGGTTYLPMGINGQQLYSETVAISDDIGAQLAGTKFEVCAGTVPLNPINYRLN